MRLDHATIDLVIQKSDGGDGFRVSHIITISLCPARNLALLEPGLFILQGIQYTESN